MKVFDNFKWSQNYINFYPTTNSIKLFNGVYKNKSRTNRILIELPYPNFLVLNFFD